MKIKRVSLAGFLNAPFKCLINILCGFASVPPSKAVLPKMPLMARILASTQYFLPL